jgi:branched-chain amino acid transport system substrate-binding protein
MSEAGLAMVSGLNTAPSLTAIGGEPGADWQPGYLRVVPNETAVAQAVATFVLRELGVTKAAIINDGDTIARASSDMFEQVFTDLGGEVVLVAAVDKGDTDMHPVLTAVAVSGAEMLFFLLFLPEADLIVLQAKEVAGLENIILMGGGALLTDSFIESVGADGVGVYVAGRAPLEGPALDELVSAYEARYHESPRTNAPGQAFDATNLLLNGIEAVAAQDADGTLHIGRQALRDALYATTDLAGVSGMLTCDEFGDCGTAARFNVMRLDDPAAGLEGLMSNVIYTYTPGQ